MDASNLTYQWRSLYDIDFVMNGEQGDGAGGTEDMVRAAKKQGAKDVIIDINKLVIP